MINSFISRVIVVINVSILINIIFSDGLMSNLIQIGLINSDFEHFKTTTRLKLVTLFSFILIILLFYLLYSICFNSFLTVITTQPEGEGEEEEEKQQQQTPKYKLFLCCIVPILIWCLLICYLLIIAYNQDIFAPNKELYHKQPPDYSQYNGNELKKIKTILKSKFNSFLSQDKSDNSDTNEDKVNQLPWFILNLESSQFYELRFKYFKMCFFTFLNVILFCLLFFRLNLFAKCLI